MDPSRITIRSLVDGDLPTVRVLYQASRRVAFDWEPPERFQLEDLDAAIEGEGVLVAVENEQVIGFVSWWAPENFIHNLFIDPAYFRRGIGSLLLARCLEQIGRPARLKCTLRNESALAFYRARGWTIESEGIGPDGTYYLMVLREK